jgi:hypothetical protein
VVRKSRGGLQLGIGLGLWFLNFMLGALPLDKGALYLSSLLGLILLPESFYRSKVTVLGGGCVPMVG